MGGVITGILKQYSSWKCPGIKGKLKIPKDDFPRLSSSIKIIRDEFGVPHIYGKTKYDVYFGQGFVIGQERLVALDIRRKLALGNLSESLGEKFIVADRLSRTFGYYRVGKEDVKHLSERSRVAVEGFCDGLNYYLSSTDYRYPIEVVLGYPAPEKFTPEEVCAIMRMICLQMNRGYMSKIVGLAVQQILGKEKFDEDCDISKLAKIKLDYLAEMVESMPPQSQGSNSFIVSGKLTESGFPLYENDCHLQVMSPSTWMQMHLKCDDFDCSGHVLVGLIGIQTGVKMNKMAFGVTLSYADSFDVYVQEINPENSAQYKFDDKWVDFKVIEEEIKVKGRREPVIEKIFYTENCGMIISKVVDFQEDTGNVKFHYSLRATSLEMYEFDVFSLVLACETKDLDDFLSICKWCAALSSSIAFTDSKDIGIVMTGGMPKRSEKTLEKLGAPLPGWDSEFIWRGFQEEIPIIMNPDLGYVVCCNHDVFTFHGAKTPFGGVSNSWVAPARALRIRELLNEIIKERKVNLKDIENISNDVKEFDISPTKNLMILLSKNEKVLENAKEIEKLAIKTMVEFDGNFTADSVGGGLFEVFRDQSFVYVFRKYGVKSEKLIQLLSGGGISPKFLEMSEYLSFGAVVKDKVFARLFPSEEEKAVAILDILKMTLDRLFVMVPDAHLKKNEQSKLDCFELGKFHQVYFEHAIGEKLPNFNRGPYPVGGTWSTVKMAGRFVDNKNHKVMYYPSMKNFCDVGDIENTTHSAVWPGNSCHIGSKWFDDGIDLYLNDKMRRAWITDEDVEKHSEGTLLLEKI